MQILEEYNARLLSMEDGAISSLNQVLDSSFNRLVRRARIHIKAGYADQATRNLALLQEFRQLVPAFNPAQEDSYDRIFRRLTEGAQRQGLDVADQLLQRSHPGRQRIDVSIPLDATIAAVGQSKGYLRRHGERFAETTAATVAQGVAEGRPTDAMVEDMRQRLGVVKHRARTIVRTESLRAYNTASDNYYTAQGVSLVAYYATSDDRTCQFCAPTAGQIFKRGTITTPRHPQCRCYLAPWDESIANMDPDYVKALRQHRREVLKAYNNITPVTTFSGRAAPFDQTVPEPVTSV